MCNELRPQRLPLLERGDPGYEAPGGVVGKVVEAGEVGGRFLAVPSGVVSRPSRAMCRGAKRDASLTLFWMWWRLEGSPWIPI